MVSNYYDCYGLCEDKTFVSSLPFEQLAFLPDMSS